MKRGLLEIVVNDLPTSTEEVTPFQSGEILNISRQRNALQAREDLRHILGLSPRDDSSDSNVSNAKEAP